MQTDPITSNVAVRRALIIDDDEDYRKLVSTKLKRLFPHLIINEVDPLQDPMPDDNFCWDNIDCIILDYELGIEYTGLDWFKKFKSEELPATILLTAKGSEELAVTAMKIGIDDYIVKEHFNNQLLANSIIECVGKKIREKEKIATISKKSVVFNKSKFIHRLKLITRDKDTNNHLFMIKPMAYQQIGRERGIHYQDCYIRHVADCIYDYFSTKNINFNILIYREEYLAVLFEASSYHAFLKGICSRLKKEKYITDMKKYECSIHVGVINPQSLEASELEKSDFELLSIAMVLCNTAKSDHGKEICNYSDIDPNEISYPGIIPLVSHGLQTFDLENAIAEGRVSANYQPWVYIASDERANLKDIYDVRIEFIDKTGTVISQSTLVRLLDNAFARRIVDKWVLRNTILRLKDKPDNGEGEGDIKFSVKITLSSFAEPNFINWLRTLLITANIPRGRLLVEIDANQLLRDPQHYKVLIDEVGTDFEIKSVLSGITEIEKYAQARELRLFNFVKLNMGKLTYGLPRDPLRTLVRKIKYDGAKVVAVNVANAEALAMAAEFEVDYMHGYLVGRPNSDIITDSTGDLYCVI